jgi:hypothetical protein
VSPHVLSSNAELGHYLESMSLERDHFESSYATRLNRSVGLYFGLRP